MNKLSSIFLATTLVLSCADNDAIDNAMHNQKLQKEMESTRSVQLSINQIGAGEVIMEMAGTAQQTTMGGIL